MTLIQAPVSRMVQLARERDARDWATADEKGLYFDFDAARRAVKFFGQLKHWKGEWAGQPFQLAKWQAEDILFPLFGWHRADGTRRFRIAYLEVPRKNGKSTFAAGIGLYLLGADGESGAEVYSCGTKRDQAKIVFNDAKEMANRSPEYRGIAQVLTNAITVRRTGSTFLPLGADSNTLDGLNPHGTILDELHAHKTRELWDVMVSAVGARRQPLTLAITTAGVYAPESIGWEQHDHAVKVLEGTLEDDAYFAYIASADPDDDWREASTWIKANPNMGTSLKLDYIRDQAQRAADTPSALNAFLRRHLNIWTQQAERWIASTDWNACNLRASPEQLAGAEAFAGLDLASTKDIAAFVLVFPDVNGTFDVVCRFWCPEDNIETRARLDRVPYDQWVRDGYLTATPGNVIDFDVILRDIVELGELYNIREIGFDRWGAPQITTQLGNEGFEVFPIGQGFASLSAPAKAVEVLVKRRQLAHAANPVLRWMSSNVTIEEDAAGNIKPSKKRSSEKIDGMVALIMAVDRALRYADEANIHSGELTLL